jgi:hypothetical protein
MGLVNTDMAAMGWGIPTETNYNTLNTYLSSSQGGKLKETGLTYWTTPNTGATNEINFNARGAGYRRSHTGLFVLINNQLTIFTTTETAGDTAKAYYLYYDGADAELLDENKKSGVAIRLFRAATTTEQSKADGSACDYYYGNDGKVYRTVKIGTQIWLADNLAETKLADGNAIAKVTDNAAWAALATAALCAYDNDENNV